MEIVAESIGFAGKASERRRKICFRVFRPEPDPRGDCRCVVELRGLARREVIYGLDSFQALLLAAVRRLAGRISDFLDEGWVFGSSHLGWRGTTDSTRESSVASDG